jgi:hypothetical protein
MIVHQLLFLAIALFIKANYLIFSTTFSLHSGAYSEGGIVWDFPNCFASSLKANVTHNGI